MKIPAPPMPDFDDPDDEANYLGRGRARSDRRTYVALGRRDDPGRQGCTAAAAADTDDPKAIFTASLWELPHARGRRARPARSARTSTSRTAGLEEAIAQITNGGGAMPAFGDQLTEEQIQALAEYIVEVDAAAS